MSKKDYIKFAKMIYILAKYHENDTDTNCFVNCLKTHVAGIFACDNSHFDRERFYDACEAKEG